MKNDKLDSIGYIDGNLIEKAEKYTVTKKKTWIKVAAVAAAACMAGVLLIFGLGRFNENIVYADEFDQSELMLSDVGVNVTISDGLKKLKSNTLVRVAIAVHENSLAYPEIGFSWSNSDVSWNDYLNFCDYVMSSEMEFLKENGAEDIERLGRSVLACTMRVGDISKLNEGKDSYTVVLFTARNSDYKEGESLDINSYDGEYRCSGLVNISLYSSFCPQEEFINSGQLIIKDGRVTLEFTNSFDADFYHVWCNDGEAVLVENMEFDDESVPGFGSNVCFDELKYAAHSTYMLKDCNRNAKLYLTDGGKKYVDLGLWGLYLFE